MDCHDHIIVESERKRGQHLGQEERGAIQQLSKLGYSLRSIAAKIDCSASTVLNELRRGTPKRKSAKGRTPEYSAKRGLARAFHRTSASTPVLIRATWTSDHPREGAPLHVTPPRTIHRF